MRKTTSTAAATAGCLFVLAVLAVYIGVFIWYINTAAPSVEPSHYNTFWWGLVHGVFVVPTFFVSLFSHGHMTIYQAPNSGWPYNLGFLLGAGLLLGGGSRSARRSR